MPARSGSDVRCIRPRERSGSVRATSSVTTVLSGNTASARPAGPAAYCARAGAAESAAIASATPVRRAATLDSSIAGKDVVVMSPRVRSSLVDRREILSRGRPARARP